jgi:hypothetical protein
MRWFFDNNLAPGLAEAARPILQIMLGRASDEAIHLRDRFPVNAKDHDWLRALVPPGTWAIVSGDVDISRVPAERKAWIDSGNVAFFLVKGWTNLPPNVQLSKLALLLPAMAATADHVRPPAGFMVPMNSIKLRQIY